MNDLKNNQTMPEALRSNRVSNSIKNAIVRGLFISLSIVTPFFIRLLMVKYLGEEYLGLNNLFLSIFNLINITELGIGSVIVFFLYEPAANGDVKLVNAYLKEIKKLYKIVGLIVITVGLIVTFSLPLLVHENSVRENINVLFLLYLIDFAVGYFVFPHLEVLFNAYQRGDVVGIISIIGAIVTYSVQIISLIVLRNYIVYILANLLQIVVCTLLRMYYQKKYLPEFIPIGDLPADKKREIRKKIVALFGHQMDERLLNSADNLFVSAILGLAVLACYSNYYCVILSVGMLADVVFNAALASIGNALVVESEANNYIRFRCVMFLGAIIAGGSSVVLYCTIQPFMELWMPGQMLGMDIVILLVAYSYLSVMRRAVLLFKNAGGLWEKDKLKPYIAAVVDIALNVVLLKTVGLIGVVISSIVAVSIIEMPWEVSVLYDTYFKKSKLLYLKDFIIYTFVNICCLLICKYILGYIRFDNPIFRLLMSGACGLLVCLIVFSVCYIRREEFKIWKETFLELLGR